jgi:predicted nucleic acid-binding protein
MTTGKFTNPRAAAASNKPIVPATRSPQRIPPTVHRELQHQKTPPRVRAWAQSLPAWVKVQSPTVLDNSLNVDEGEKEAICLAREVKAIAILMDDRKGRAEAVRIS